MAITDRVELVTVHEGTEAGRDPFNKSLTDLIGELSTRSEEFRALWAAHNVRLRLRALSTSAVLRSRSRAAPTAARRHQPRLRPRRQAGPLVMPPVMALLLQAVPARRSGVASGVFNTSRQVGGASAIAVFGALLADRATFVHGLRLSLLIAAAVALAAAAVSRLLSPKPPAGSARQRPAQPGSTGDRGSPAPISRRCGVNLWGHDD